MDRLAGLNIVVTGAAQGIGEAVAQRCAAEGARLLLVDLDPAVQVVAKSVGADAVVGDVSDAEFVKKSVADFAAGLGVLHGLVNVAGVHRRGDLLEMTDEDWDLLLRVNLTAPMLWSRSVLPFMISAGAGSIVNVASLTGSRARPVAAAYTASKAGLIGLTKSIAMDFGKYAIRANCVSPGSIATPMLKAHVASGGAGFQEQIDRTPLARLGEPSEIAGTCAFLLSADGAFVSGMDILVDGGRTAIS
jgi:NAD(P)-dependent dehydrogenase (short-subunit alcohol dehydrogenase family)